MQNKTINTVFLGIIIILLAIGIWFLAKGNTVTTDTDKKPVVEEEEKPPVVKKDNVSVPNPTPKPTVNQVLQTIFNKNKNAKIDECEYNGGVYYSTSMNAYDGGGSTFDSNGNVVGSYQGFTGKYTGINPTNCKNIYTVYPNIWGLPAVNIYNLK